MALSQYSEYENAYRLLTKSALSGRVAGAYIIEGDNLTDKRGLAMNFAKAIMCKEEPGQGCDGCVLCKKIDHGNYEDIYVIDREKRKSIGVQQIRDIWEMIITKPIGEGNRNIIIIEDGDLMTRQAQNVLLKTLEESPEGTVIIILSENTDNLITTIKSRCIAVRLYSFRHEDSQEGFFAVAEKVMQMTMDREPFFKISNYLAKKVKDDGDAVAFLDGLEKIVGKQMIQRNTIGRAENMERYNNIIKYAEEAKRDIRYNVGHKYALRNLMLKTGMEYD